MKFTRSIETSDLQLFGTLEDAQMHELKLILSEHLGSPLAAAEAILENQDKILDILTTTEKSRPAGRKINGATRKKRANPAAVNAALQDAKQ